MKLALSLCGAIFSFMALAGPDCSKEAAAAVKSCESRLKGTVSDKEIKKAEVACQKTDEKACVDQCGHASAVAAKQGLLELSEINDQVANNCIAQIGRLLEAADDARAQLIHITKEARAAASAVFGGSDVDEHAKPAVESEASENVIAKPICFNQGGVLKSTLAVPISQIQQGLAMINDGYFGPDAIVVPCP